MKVKIEKTWLAQGEHESVAGFRINGQRLTQTAQFLRAEAISVFDRKNHQTTVTFSITRLHESTQDAEVFILEHSTGLKHSGLIAFIAQGSHGRETVRYLQAACITVDDASYIGLSTRHNYTIIGGRILNQKPKES